MHLMGFARGLNLLAAPVEKGFHGAIAIGLSCHDGRL